MMNSDFMTTEAKAFAARLTQECGVDQGCQVRRAYKVSLGRAPTVAEVKLASDFFRNQGKVDEFTLALLNRNEFVYIP